MVQSAVWTTALMLNDDAFGQMDGQRSKSQKAWLEMVLVAVGFVVVGFLDCDGGEGCSAGCALGGCAAGILVAAVAVVLEVADGAGVTVVVGCAGTVMVDPVSAVPDKAPMTTEWRGKVVAVMCWVDVQLYVQLVGLQVGRMRGPAWAGSCHSVLNIHLHLTSDLAWTDICYLVLTD